MPYQFELDNVARVVRSWGWGVLTDDDLLNHLERMRQFFADGTLDSTWAQVVDCSAVESFHDVSCEGLCRQARLNPWPNGSLRAVIAPMDIGFGLGRMYETLCEDKGENVRIFRSEAEAFAWIIQEGHSSGQAT
jgi:hypothetical protein